MGYLSWGSKPSKKRGAAMGGDPGGRHGGGMKKPTTPPAATVAAAAAAGGGCMNTVLHIFYFQRFHLCLHSQLHQADFPPPPPPPPLHPTTATTTSFPSNLHPSSLKGVEAPRNSLESEEMVTARQSLASITGDKTNDPLHIPMGIEINTSRRDTGLKLVQAPRGKNETPTSECSNSPGMARTPTLVARLMGLDILPESSSTTTTPRSSLHSPLTASSAPPRKARIKPSSYSYDNYGPHSLPETPRRLSLQINKENSIVREMESSRPSCSAINMKRCKDGKTNYYEEVETRSPRYYARQILKQVKETVSRRVGIDITNTINNGSRDHRRDENLLTLSTKPRKPKKPESHSNTNNPSPRLKSSSEVSNSKPSSLNMSENLPSSPASECAKSEALQVLSMAVKPPPKPSEEEREKLPPDAKPCVKKRTPLKCYDSIRNKKEEQCVRSSATNKKCKKTPFSSDLLHGSVPFVFPLKKDSSRLLHNQASSSKAQPSKPIISKTTTTKTTFNAATDTTSSVTSAGAGAQLSRFPSHQVQEKAQKETTHGAAYRSDSIAEFQYISRILKCTGIDRDTPVTLARWFSSSHPLDPSIFHSLEDTHYSDHHHRLQPALEFFNRRLIFHLVDELLADLLKPYIKLKSSYFGSLRVHSFNDHQQIYGFQLVKILCTRIRSFPSANCQTLQDIDALVEKDMPKNGGGLQRVMNALEEEGDAIVSEVEGDILDSLVDEVVVFFLGSPKWSINSMHKSYVNAIRLR